MPDQYESCGDNGACLCSAGWTGENCSQGSYKNYVTSAFLRVKFWYFFWFSSGFQRQYGIDDINYFVHRWMNIKTKSHTLWKQKALRKYVQFVEVRRLEICTCCAVGVYMSSQFSNVILLIKYFWIHQWNSPVLYRITWTAVFAITFHACTASIHILD